MIYPRRFTGFRVVMLSLGVLLAASCFGQDVPPVKKGKPVVAPKAAPRKGSTIVDDTTKNVYGPKTVTYTTEKSLFYNKNVYVPIDTSFINLHRWTYIQRFNNFYKDIGNVGTALSPIFPMISPTIGVTSGFNSYSPYFDTEEPKYFDTKSPYTQLDIIWGGNGRAMTKIEFSRNINSRWNFGFNYRPIWVDRQIQRQKSIRQTVSQYYDFYTTYRSKNDRYFLLFNYRRIRHRVFENGGVKFGSDSSYKALFDPNAALNLPVTSFSTNNGAATEDYRTGIHLLQHYQLAKAFQLYNMTDVNGQTNKFTYKTGATSIASLPPSFFDYSRGDSLNNDDRARLRIIQNESGIKGNAGPLFYDYYFKLRSFEYENHYQQQGESILAYKRSGLEKYVGARMALQIDTLTELSGTAEYLLDGHYKIEGDLKSRWIDASLRSTLSRPGFMQNIYQGSHNQWNNSFTNVSSQQLTGFIKAKLGPLLISPGATFTTLNHYVYFKYSAEPTGAQHVLPYQSDFQIVFAPELRFSLTVLKKLSLTSQTIYTSLLKNDGDALQIPTLFVNGQIAYTGSFFKNALHVQVGFDLHYKSAYYALGYAPSIQQFYVQQQVQSPEYLLADVFINAKIKRGRFFFKYQNITQAITGVGYMPTPTYPGQSNLLDFGFLMLLFD